MFYYRVHYLNPKILIILLKLISVDAIKRIKDIYKISRMKWQGDPCGPTGFTWDGLTCNAGNPPRIISL